MAPLAPPIGPHLRAGLEDLDAAGGRTGAAAYQRRSAGDGPAASPAGGQLKPVQPSGAADPNLKVLGEPGAGGGDTELGSTSSLALGGWWLLRRRRK